MIQCKQKNRKYIELNYLIVSKALDAANLSNSYIHIAKDRNMLCM